MREAPLYSAAGARSASFTLPQPFFDGTVHEPALHQAVTAYRNNQRQGTAATKNRKVVTGGNQKPWRQKGTGRARQGSTRAPHWRGGGTVFGPIPRDYRTTIPAKVRQLARRSALNARAREGALLVIESLVFDQPKTARLAELLGKLGLDGKKALILTAAANRNLYLSGRNLPAAQVLPFGEASTYDILWADVLVVEREALGGGVATEVSEAEAAAPAKPAKPKAKKPAAAKAAAKKPAAKGEAKRVAPKRGPAKGGRKKESD
jgi:large subunit ribosomal protein L4